MTGENQLPVLPKPQEKTAAGNYFVANYPPFSLWQPQYVTQVFEQLDLTRDHDRPLGLYVHIPFCRKRCHFCYFRIYTDRNKDDIRAYLDAVIQEASMVARRAYVEGRPIKFIYFGGGTPSYLSEAQLSYLLTGLRQALPCDEAEEIAFEAEPGTLNQKKVRALRDMGITRLSLGIENFDDEILEMNNRAHQSKQVFAAYDWVRSTGFDQINIDLIAGMLGETSENWQRCVDTAVSLQPDVVTIYQMEIPYNTTIYQQMKDRSQTIAPVADWPTKRQWVHDAFTVLEQAGYTISSAYTAVRDPRHTRFVYRDALWDGADMLGLGVSSFGLLGRVHYQNQHNIEPYVSDVATGQLPIYRALTMTREEQMIRQFVLQLKLGHLSREPFQERFGTDIFDYFSVILQTYEREGYLNRTADELHLTRRGLLEIDRLLHAFFLPAHREVRYA